MSYICTFQIFLHTFIKRTLSIKIVVQNKGFYNRYYKINTSNRPAGISVLKFILKIINENILSAKEFQL